MHYLKKSFSFIDQQANQYWSQLFLGFSLFLIFSLFIKTYNGNTHWTSFHLNIFTTSFFFFIAMFLGFKIRPILFSIILLLTIFLDIKEHIYIVADWLFFYSPIKSWFDTIAVKDSNVFLILCFILLGIGSLIKLFYIKIKYHKWNFQLVFTALTIFSVIFITAIFHYILIEKYFRKVINNEMSHIENVYNITNEQDFNTVCLNQKYLCSFNGGIEDISNKTNHPNFKKTLEPYINGQTIKGNFPVDLETHTIYLVVSNGNKWVIETKKTSDSFAFSEELLMFSLSYAHGFWLMFYTWLLLFHNRRIFNPLVIKT